MAKHAPHRVTSTFRAQSHFFRPTAAALAVAACFSGPVLANPTNPTVVHGTATFATAGNIFNITNSHNAIINWGSFSIGVNELTRFIQPSALSAVLNRVTGQDPSAILGALQSNGRVFLLNPNGIVFGAGAQINVAGLVASTLNLSNEDFLNNRMRFTDGAGAGSVVNQGSITGGNVYLVGKSVSNESLITSPNGEVVLAAGNSVELVNPGTPNLRVEVVAPDNEARNLGTISAEAGRIGIYAGLIKQSGTLKADSAVSEGGRIVLKSTKKTVLEAGSLTSARGTSGGEIIALSSMTDGVTEVAGKMDASGTAGNGGFIETSAGKVKIADSATITAAAGSSGQAGTWLIDPNDFFISSSYGGDITGSTLASQLEAYGGTNVTIVSDNGFTFGLGDIYVNDSVSWSSNGALTLIARNNVEVNNFITNGSTGGVNLYAGWDGVSMVTPTVNFFGIGAINLNAPISTGGDLHLVAGGNIFQGAPGSITAVKLLASSNGGIVDLANPVATNAVGEIAGTARGFFAFKNSGPLIIGSVGASTGIIVNPGAGRNVTVNVDVTGGQLTVNSPVYAYGGDGGEGQAGGNATITLASSSSMQINNSITADGGLGGNGSFFIDPGAGGNATVNLTSAGGLTIAANVGATGGSGGEGPSFTNGGRGGDGVINATVAGTLAVAYGGSVYGYGGRGGNSYDGVAGRGGDGKVMLSAVGGISIASGQQVRGEGGNGGDGGSFSFSYGGNGIGGNGGDGMVELTSTGGSITVAGNVWAGGGWGGDGGSSFYGGSIGGNGGNAAIALTSTAGGITISGSVNAEGGWVGYGASGMGNTGGNATINLTSMGNITVESGASIDADGGEGIQGGNAMIVMNSSSAIEVMSGGSVQTNGGDAYDGGTAGSTSINLTASGAIMVAGEVDANGGDGSSGAAGGAATTTLTSTASNVSISGGAEVEARGGDAGFFGSSTGGAGTVVINSAGNTSISDFSVVEAYGGDGGDTGFGGNAVVLVSASGGISVNNGSLWSSGGSANSGQGGAAALTMLAGGNLQIGGGEGAAWGGNGATGGNAAVTVVAGGNIDMMSGGNFTAYSNTGVSSVGVSAAGNVMLASNANIDSGGLAGLGGVNIILDNAYVSGSTGVQVDATGSLDLMNNSFLSSGGNAVINTGGNVTVDNSGIYGNPEVVMNVGGVINMNNLGTIEAESPSTIFLTFPMLSSGGFFVNGLEGLVYESGTGFKVLGNPAELGVNLFVTYGGGTTLIIPNNNLIVAMGESSTPPDPEKEKDLFEELKKEEKDAPVCR